MAAISLVERHEQERLHGRSIADSAEKVWWQESPVGRERVARRSRLIVEATGMRPGMHVLELGCGTGSYTSFFAQTGAMVTAVDISEELLARSREKLPSVTFLCDIAEELRNIPDASQDAVVGNAILHHLDVPLALRAAMRVLRPGGVFCFTEPNMLNPQIAAERNIPYLRKRLGNTPSETAFFRWQITRALREAGFVDTSARPFDFLHPSTPTVLLPVVRMVSLVCERLPLVREIAGSLLIVARKPAQQ